MEGVMTGISRVKIMKAVVAQFQCPRGPLGHVVGWIMANRASNRERTLWTLDLLGIEPHHNVLEIGFGPGYAIEQLVLRLRTGKIVGLDHSQVMVEQATQRNQAAIQTGQVTLHCLPVDALDTIQVSFERIFSANVAQFWPERVAVYRAILRHLKPGGCVATTYLPRHANATDADAIAFGQQLLTDMQTAGFTQVELKEGPRLPILTISAIGYA